MAAVQLDPARHLVVVDTIPRLSGKVLRLTRRDELSPGLAGMPAS